MKSNSDKELESNSKQKSIYTFTGLPEASRLLPICAILPGSSTPAFPLVILSIIPNFFVVKVQFILFRNLFMKFDLDLNS